MTAPVRAPRVAFRVDATAATGWGHLKRCLALAEALRARGARTRWAGRSDSPAVASLLRAAGQRWYDLGPGSASPHSEAVGFALLWSGLRPDLVVVDHYQLDARWHRAARATTGARIVVIDDLADRALEPDLLVDHNPHVDHVAKYREVLTQPVRGCFGLRHALLDPVYAQQEHIDIQAQPRAIGIIMGATDPAGHAPWVLRILRSLAGWGGEVVIATTSANPGLDAVRTAAQTDGNTTLLLDSPHLADVYADLDLAIVAGGGALWECCRMGLPTVALMTTDNHHQSVPLAAAVQAVLALDATGQRPAQAEALGGAVRRLLLRQDQRQALQDQALQLVDGQGAARVAHQALRLLPWWSNGRGRARPTVGEVGEAAVADVAPPPAEAAPPRAIATAPA